MMKNKTPEEYEIVIEQALRVCQKYEGAKLQSPKLQNYFQDDLLRIGYLLATMDGILCKEEMDMICQTFHVIRNEELLKKYYWEDVCLKNNFLQKIPKSILYVISQERRQMGDSFSIFLKDARVLYKAVKQFGYAIISCKRFQIPYQIVALEDLSRNILNVILNAEDMDIYFEEMDLNNSDTSIGEVLEIPGEPGANGQKDHFGMGYDRNNPYSKTTEGAFFYNPYEKLSGLDANYDSVGSRKPPVRPLRKSTQELVRNQQKEQKGVEEILKEIDGLIGLEGVKQQIHSLVNLLQVQKIRKEKGLKHPVISNHLVFTGNPGTGKTTIARKMAEIYHCLGILEKGHLIETDRSGMVAGYMGQTAEKVKELIDKAMGGVLFIDEAYTLSNHKMEGDFGQEAIDTLLKAMEDERENFVVIVAGYPEPMEEFLNSNPGLRSRFNKHIRFEDYSVSQLSEIFHQLCSSQDYRIDPEAETLLLFKINQLVTDSRENFANARAVRNYFEDVVARQANRIVTDNSPGTDPDEFITIRKEDL